MSVAEVSTLSEQCRTFVRALKEAVGCGLRRIDMVLRSHERWAPVTLPASVCSVLFICKGNMCRSPLAAVYFQSLLTRMGSRMVVNSAGLETNPGKPAHPSAKTVALQQELTLDTHVTVQVHAELLDKADLIVVMEERQKHRIQRLYPKTKGKVVLLGSFDPNGPLDIADPYSGPLEEFVTCFHRVQRCCDNLAARLRLSSDMPGSSVEAMELPSGAGRR
jgi:protein-tyrosine phosphatase